jgi:hypothetical protein
MTALPPGLLWPVDAVKLLRTLWIKDKLGLGVEVFTADDMARLSRLINLKRRLDMPAPERRLARGGRVEQELQPGDPVEAGRTPDGGVKLSRLELNLNIASLQAKAATEHQQKKMMREMLTLLLGTAKVGTVFLASASGRQFEMAPSFWYSSSAPRAWKGEEVQWLFGKPPQWKGRVLVDRESLMNEVRSWGETNAQPREGETKTAYIIRALNMKKVREISAKEGREIAPYWLKAKGLPSAPKDIAAEALRMTSLIRKLVPRDDSQPKSKPKSKPKRTRREPGANRERREGEPASRAKRR